jgi:hypothetical protein
MSPDSRVAADRARQTEFTFYQLVRDDLRPFARAEIAVFFDFSQLFRFVVTQRRATSGSGV